MSVRAPSSRISRTFSQLISLPAPCEKVWVAIPLFVALAEAADMPQKDGQAYAANAKSLFAFLVLPLFTRPAAPRHAVGNSNLPVETKSSPIVKESFLKERQKLYAGKSFCQGKYRNLLIFLKTSIAFLFISSIMIKTFLNLLF